MRKITALASLTLSVGCAGSTPAPAPVVQPEAPALQFPLPFASAPALAQACEAKLVVAETRFRRAKAAKPAKVLSEYNQLEQVLDRLAGPAELIAQTHPNKAVREAAEACQLKTQAFSTKISLDRALYDALAAATTEGLDPADKRSLERALRQLRLQGVDKDEATRAQLKNIKDELTKVGQDFAAAIRDDTKKLSFTEAELEGLPADFIAQHEKDKDGKIIISTAYPDFYPVERYAKSEAVRKQLYEAFLSRGYPKNEANMRRMLELRDQYAKLLGFDSWADYAAAEMMAKDAKTIDGFLNELDALIDPKVKAEQAILLKRKQQDHPKATTIDVWDRFYYVDRVRAEAKAPFDTQSVRPYFQYPAVAKGIMDLYGELFGLRFEKDSEAKVWDPSVSAYKLYAGDTLVGEFFLDMHPREGKYGHAAEFPIQTGLAGTQLPMAALVTNFPAPKEGAPALMEHQQVVTFFHEFGHLVHHLLANSTKWVNLNGIRTEWDFVEAPSQLLEEWAWRPEVLARFAKHYQTGEPIPAALVARMVDADKFGRGMAVQRQLFYAYLSLLLHKDAEIILKKGDLDAAEAEVAKKYSPFSYPAGTHGYASFGHLNGYSSNYYTYQWSLALAKDIFTRFLKEGLINPRIAKAYRDAVLRPGGSKDAALLVEDFLGRASTLEAYKHWLLEE